MGCGASTDAVASSSPETRKDPSASTLKPYSGSRSSIERKPSHSGGGSGSYSSSAGNAGNARASHSKSSRKSRDKSSKSMSGHRRERQNTVTVVRRTASSSVVRKASTAPSTAPQKERSNTIMSFAQRRQTVMKLPEGNGAWSGPTSFIQKALSQKTSRAASSTSGADGKGGAPLSPKGVVVPDPIEVPDLDDDEDEEELSEIQGRFRLSQSFAIGASSSASGENRGSGNDNDATAAGGTGGGQDEDGSSTDASGTGKRRSFKHAKGFIGKMRNGAVMRKDKHRRKAVSAEAIENEVGDSGRGEGAMLAGIENASITLQGVEHEPAAHDDGSGGGEATASAADGSSPPVASPSSEEQGAAQSNARADAKSTGGVAGGDGGDTPKKDEAKQTKKFQLNDEQLSAIKLAFKRNNLFASLDDDVIDQLSVSVIPLVVKKDTVVVRQNENGNFFFIVYKGSFRCEKKVPGSDESRTIAIVGEHSCFGELSLMYNCPRKASVIALEDSEIFALERAVFTKTVVEVSSLKTRERIEFLRQVPLLQNLTDTELGKLSSCVTEEVHKGHARVCNQGDEGHCMYLIYAGTLKVMRRTADKSGDKNIANLGPGDYFGEQALLKDDVRSASVMVSSQSAILLKLAREDFEVLLGPLMSFVSDSALSKHYRMVRELPVMSSLSDLEINQLLQAMVPVHYSSDEIVSVDGDASSSSAAVSTSGAGSGTQDARDNAIAFAIIVEGEVEVVDRVDVVRRLFRGDYFGTQLSMLPAKSLILRARSDLQCIALRMEDYTSLMGPLKKANKKRLEELDRLKTILESFKLVSQLDEEEFSLLSDMAEEKQFSPGDHIVEAQRPNSSAYIIMEGYVEIIEPGKDVYFKMPGEYFGQEVLITGSSGGGSADDAGGGSDADTAETISEYSAVASQQTDCVVISQQMIRAVMSKRGHTSGDVNSNLFAIRVMKAVPLFSNFSFEELSSLANVVTMREIKSGEVILEQGAPGDEFFIIKSGKCDVIRNLGAMERTSAPSPSSSSAESRSSSAGAVRGGTQHERSMAPQLIARLNTGDFFGEISLLTSKPVTATVKANGPVEVLVMSSADFSKAGGKLMAEVAHASNRRLIKDQNSFAMHNYNLVQVLGRGAIGTVRLVQHIKTKRYYALKSMRKDMIKAYKQEEHVINEKRIMAMLDHPNLVNLFSYSASKTHLYLLIEFVQGGDFFSLLRHNGCLPEKIVKFYGACVVSAFQYLHSHGIVYRDLKPENLLVDSTGYLKLTDFGLAKFVKDKTFTTCGTPEYMAPELVTHAGHDKSVDYWALGCLLYEMVGGITPFLQSDEYATFDAILTGEISFNSEFESREVKDIITRLCNVRPVKRLGCGAGGTKAVMNHAFFREIKFADLEKKKLVPPFVPDVTTPGDTSYFPRGKIKLYDDLQEGREMDVDQLDMEFSSYNSEDTNT